MADALSATVTCDGCGTDYEGYWPAEDDEQDEVEAPITDQVCPGCGHVQAEEYPGWSFHTEAG